VTGSSRDLVGPLVLWGFSPVVRRAIEAVNDAIANIFCAKADWCETITSK